jgi:hypothetical protein
MAHKANANFYLYTGLTSNASECSEAYEHLRALFPNEDNTKLGGPFTHLFYGDPSQIPEVITNLQTWFLDMEPLAFPLVTYDQIYDFTDQPNRIVKCVNGLDAIKSTDWVALTSFAG